MDEKIKDNLLKTKDGIIIMPGMRIFWDSYDIRSSAEGYEVSEIRVYKKTEGDTSFNGDVAVIDEKNGNQFFAPHDFGLYSSVEALNNKKQE